MTRAGRKRRKAREWWLVGRKYIGLSSVWSSEAAADKEFKRLAEFPEVTREIAVKVHVREVVRGKRR